MNSCPMTIGTLMVFCDQASQFQMWMSVPQMLAFRTLKIGRASCRERV